MENFSRLTNEEVTAKLSAAVNDETTATSRVIALVIEFDSRDLWQKLSYTSLFLYCTRKLRMSEDEAGRRIHVARHAQRFPVILNMLESGALRLTAVNILGPHLTPGNHLAVLGCARGKTRRELEMMAAELSPRSELADVVRRLPDSPAAAVGVALSPMPGNPFMALPAGSPCADPPCGGPEPAAALDGEAVPSPRISPAGPPQRIEPLSPKRIRFAFTGSPEHLRRIDRARELLRHKYPVGALEDIIFEALEALLEKRDPDRHPPPKIRRGQGIPGGRGVPAWVKRIVWDRDAGACAFMGADGLRCGSRDWLEYDHIVPWAKGGSSTDPGNLRLLCRTHNQQEARGAFGGRAEFRGRYLRSMT